jgi:hypothetical protein
LASMAHRVAKGLVGGCVLLLGATVTGCAAPQYTYVANSSESTYFKVPHSWHQISPDSLAKILQQDSGGSGGGWTVAYQAGSSPTAGDFLNFDTSQPFVFADVGTLTSTASQGLSYNELRDFFLPVTSSTRQEVSSQGNFPLTDFKQLSDQQLMLSQGVHGVREIYDYTDAGISDTFDEVALTNADQTVVYLLVLHCTTSCYNSNQTEINDVMTSFTVRSP